MFFERASHNGLKTSVKDYLGTRISPDAIPAATASRIFAHRQTAGTVDPWRAVPHPRVHQLDEDGHVVIALTGEPLLLGVHAFDALQVPMLRRALSNASSARCAPGCFRELAAPGACRSQASIDCFVSELVPTMAVELRPLHIAQSAGELPVQR